MEELAVASEHVGGVYVIDRHVELLGADAIDRVVLHLRLNGGQCWLCGGRLHRIDDVSLVVDETALTGILGFIHYRCGPPQISDRRRNRRAAIERDAFREDGSTDAQAFASLRNYPAPHAALVVSQQMVPFAMVDNGDTISSWFDSVLAAGLDLIAPDWMDAVPAQLDEWTLQIEGDRVVCGLKDHPLYVGQVDMPEPWLDALAAERQCVVFVAGVGVDSSRLAEESWDGLNLLAEQGLLAGATVSVTGVPPCMAPSVLAQR